ncbi:hypothetical protein [Acinetobacter guerrae]|uniref:hypothetical protein n=1 Tax=Acinetobacter guerrae TaxID=1843371 RepID=UPI00125F785E|nr:hypothetical protein [Acinetobacter guerrae]
MSSTQSPEVINFGKFKGTPLTDLKPSYVHWLLKLKNLDSDLRKKLEAIDVERERKFQRRKELAQILERTHIPSPDRRAYKRARGFVGAR